MSKPRGRKKILVYKCNFNVLRATGQRYIWPLLMQGTITVGNRLMNKRTGFYFWRKHFTNTHQTQPALGLSSPSWEKRVGWSRLPCHAIRGHPLTDQQPGMSKQCWKTKSGGITIFVARAHKDLKETIGIVPLSCQSSARWWVGQTRPHTPRESSASRLCDWPLCSLLSSRLEKDKGLN